MAKQIDDFENMVPDLDSILNDNSIVLTAEAIEKLERNWANFELEITDPWIEPINPPLVIEPELIDGEYEFVYSIHDHGNKLSVSKSEDMFSAGMSMCKLYYTIEKIIYLLIERLKSGGVDSETEVRVDLNGNILAVRKGFEAIINLDYNVVVSNFEPGEWGERFLVIMKNISEKYGFLPGAPRQPYRQNLVPRRGLSV